MRKQSQITIFMLLVIVLLFVFGFLFYLETAGIIDIIPSPAPEVTNYVTGCLALTAEQAFFTIGRNGGHLNPVDPLPTQNISVLFKDNAIKLPSEAELQRNIAVYIENHIKDCVDFSLFKDQRLVKESVPRAEVFLTKKDVKISLTYPFTLKKGDQEQQFRDFATEQDLKLYYIYQNAAHILNQQLIEKNVVDITLLFVNHPIYISEMDGHIVVSLQDPDYFINKKPFKFQFGI